MTRIVALVPAGKLFDQVFETLSAAAAEANLSITRADTELSRPGNLGAACNQIETADALVADLTGRNPNVMYQAGYAHAIGRKVLFISHFAEDFPFDPGKHELIVYAGNLEFLKREVVARWRGEPAPAAKPPSSNEAREKFLAIFGEILAEHGHEHRGEIYLENPTTFVLVNQDMDLPLVQDLSRKARELGIRLKLM